MSGRVLAALATWATIGLLLVVWLVGAEIASSRAADRYDREVAAWVKLETFYLTISGNLSPKPGAMGKLAKDLAALEPAEVVGFRGDSNRYGGITSELGFDPFDGYSCDECGPLRRDIAHDVTMIRYGEIKGIQADHVRAIEQPSSESGPPTWMIALWALALPFGVGGTWFVGKRQQEARYRDFAGERRLIHDLRSMQGELGSAEREQPLLELADQIERQIDQRVTYRETKKRDMRLEALTAEAQQVLDSIAAGNKELN